MWVFDSQQEAFFSKINHPAETLLKPHKTPHGLQKQKRKLCWYLRGNSNVSLDISPLILPKHCWCLVVKVPSLDHCPTGWFVQFRKLPGEKIASTPSYFACTSTAIFFNAVGRTYLSAGKIVTVAFSPLAVNMGEMGRVGSRLQAVDLCTLTCSPNAGPSKGSLGELEKILRGNLIISNFLENQPQCCLPASWVKTQVLTVPSGHSLQKQTTLWETI